MLKHLRQSMWLRCLVVLAFVFFVLPLSPNDAYADDHHNKTADLLTGAVVLFLVFGFFYADPFCLFCHNNDNRQSLSEKDDKEDALAERFAKLNTDKDNGISPKGRVTYPVFEW